MHSRDCSSCFSVLNHITSLPFLQPVILCLNCLFWANWEIQFQRFSLELSCYDSSYSIGEELIMGVTSTAKCIDSNYTWDLRKWSLLWVWRHNGPLGARFCPECHLLLPDPMCSHYKRRAMILCMPVQPILESVIKCELVPDIYLTAYFLWPLQVHCDTLNSLKSGHQNGTRYARDLLGGTPVEQNGKWIKETDRSMSLSSMHQPYRGEKEGKIWGKMSLRFQYSSKEGLGEN